MNNIRKKNARQILSSREKLIKSDIFQQQWYYSIELLRGLFSFGKNYANIVLTRKILENIIINDQSCIDIGTMEGFIPILLKRRGAKRVIAYDRRSDLVGRINLVKEAYNVDFQFLCGMNFNELSSILKAKKILPFDLVVFSGILYHMIDPLCGLALARGLVRNGGILLLETAAVIDKKMAMYFNAGGRFYPRTNYFMISLDALDYMLRLLRLKPLDVIYFKQRKNVETDMQICRICIPSLAINKCLNSNGDQWMRRDFQVDFNEYINWKLLENGKPNTKYRTFNKNLYFREDTGSVNVYETVVNNPEYPINEKDMILKLDDIS